MQRILLKTVTKSQLSNNLVTAKSPSSDCIALFVTLLLLLYIYREKVLEKKGF